jgi:hypothetical protein
VDHRADIFASGVVFYELLSGRKAFEGDSIATTLYKVLETHPPPVHQLDERLPEALSAVIDRALAKDRLARFQTSREMLDALVLAHGRTTPLERVTLEMMPPTAPNRATAVPVRRRVATLAGWAVAGVIVACIAGFALWSERSRNTGPSQLAAQSAPDLRGAAPAQSSTPEGFPPSVNGSATTPSPPPAAENTKGAATPPKAVEPKPPAPPPVDGQRSSPPPEVNAARAPAAVPLAAPEPSPAPAEPLPVAPPTVSPTPPPQATPAARTDENPAMAVQDVLARYRASLESRDIGALKQIWPSLSGRQEEAIRNEFEHARAIVVSFGSVDIRPGGGGATVVCRRNYAVTTADGQTLRTATTMFMTLARRDNTWSIESIRHEVAR